MPIYRMDTKVVHFPGPWGGEALVSSYLRFLNAESPGKYDRVYLNNKRLEDPTKLERGVVVRVRKTPHSRSK